MPAAGGNPAAGHCLVFADKISKLSQFIGAIRTAELEERFLLNLAYPLSGYLKNFSNLLQSVFLASLVQTIAHPNDFLFTG
jgi:hypothetical protein